MSPRISINESGIRQSILISNSSNSILFLCHFQKLRPSDHNRSLSTAVSSSISTVTALSPSVPSILGANSSVTGLGVDPNKVAQFEDPLDPPPPYGIIPEHPEEMTEVGFSLFKRVWIVLVAISKSNLRVYEFLSNLFSYRFPYFCIFQCLTNFNLVFIHFYLKNWEW